jgi:DNA end-binding protein Ku
MPFSAKIAIKYSFPRITKVAIPARFFFSMLVASSRYAFSDASAGTRNVHFHILDRTNKQPIKQRMIDPENDEEIPKEKIQRGLEVEPGTFVVIDEDELTKVEPKASRDIEIRRFVPPARINHQWYERPYYLGPDGDESAYFALAKALESRDREGVARWVMRDKQYIGALNVKDGYLVLVTLPHADEVISAKQLPTPSGRALDEKEIRMAEQLVAAL